MRTTQSSKAFTLIELLVVVSIIVALLAMLLPSMSRTREAARRAVCASNLHQMSTSTLNYAVDHHGSFPFGYGSTTRQYSYVIFDRDMGVDFRVPLGLIYSAGHLRKRENWMCPSAARLQRPDDPLWEPDAVIKDSDPSNDSLRSRSHYSIRGTLRSGDWTGDFGWRAGYGDHYASIARFQTGDVLFADWVSISDLVEGRHVDGVNTVMIGGSARWVPRAAFDAPLSQLLPIFSSSLNPFYQEVWDSLE